MGRSMRIREQLLGTFRAELVEHVQTMTDGLLSLEQSRVPAAEQASTLETIFRAAHSLKGAARAVNVTIIEQLAHSLEGVLDGMQRQVIPLTPELFTACYRSLDAIQVVQAAYEGGETTPPLAAIVALTDLEAQRTRPRSAPLPADLSAGKPGISPAGARAADHDAPDGQAMPAAAPTREETIRVSVAKLDTLMAQMGELLMARMRAEQQLHQVRHLQQFAAAWQKEWQVARRSYGRLAHNSDNGQGREMEQILAFMERHQEHIQELSALTGQFARQCGEDLMQMSLVVGEMEQEIKRVRMLPLSTISAPFGRMVRDLARDAGKEAILHVEGADTELDKQVLEVIKDPLIHLLRNAIDHGIEPPDRRLELGKKRAGTIRLTAEQAGQNVVVQVSDDGAGLDLAALRQAMARRGRPEAESLSEAELEELIFVAGVSTSSIITDLSGRGIGLAVVQRNVDSLGGRVEVESQMGHGATFVLVLPLTLTSGHGLLVRAAGQLFAIPVGAVQHIRRVNPADILSLEGQPAILDAGRPVALARLDDLLGLPRTVAGRPQENMPAVLIAAADRTVALAVDELAGEQEMVIKNLGKQLRRVAGIAGATVLGNGEVMLILNTADLIKMAGRADRGVVFEAPAAEVAPAAGSRERRILIVDDSITTRTLEKNILEAAGYRVLLATDGQEALSVLATSALPDLVVSDILMPRMDGFELTRAIRGDERMARMPVILVSSLASTADKARGIEVGADAYIVKGRFDQKNLLETIEQLI